MKNKLLFIPLMSALLLLSGCNQKEDANYQAYKRYIATLNAEEVMSYQDWLAQFKGEKGEDGKAPIIEIGYNGHFIVNTIDINVTAKGQKGDQGDQGEKGDKGEKGEVGDDAVTPYELYKAAHPDYEKSEDEFYNDLTNGRLGEQIYHLVTFDTKGGSVVAPQQILHGEKAKKPVDPVKEGFTFKCWTYENEVWSFIGMPVTFDINLVAVYE